MRKSTAFLLLLMLSAATLPAQLGCGGGRYLTEVFNNFTRTNDITYGSNINLQGNNQSLELDLWEPQGDVEPLRPLIVLEHGGSFTSGNKGAADITSLTGPLAKRGYVLASVEYRLGMEGLPFPGPDSAKASESVWRAVADMKAAVRFFYKSAINGNPYRIDTNHIYVGGVSAGAVSAIHYAYLDDIAEMPSYIDTTKVGLGGGIEGSSGNPGYSSRIAGVVNICGMIADTAWMRAGDEPIVSLHGPADNVVPYGTAMITVAGFYPIFVVDGSHTIMLKATQLGMDNCLYTYYGAGHTPHITGSSTAAYLDTTLNVISGFLHHLICGGPTACNAVVSVNEANLERDVVIFPNPSSGIFNLRLPEGSTREWTYSLTDVTGRKVGSGMVLNSLTHRIERSDLPAGIYLLRMEGEGFSRTERVVLR